MSKLLFESITEKLKEFGVEFVASGQAQAQATTLFKTQFFKDKKHRCFLVFSLAATKYNIKVLSARLGLGKAGLTEASPELVEAVFQGPASLLGLSSAAAAETLLLVDAGVLALPEGDLFELPGSPVSLLPSDLPNVLSSLGLVQAPIITDLLADPKIDRENPPDLKAAVDAANPVPAAVPADAEAKKAPAPKQESKEKPKPQPKAAADAGEGLASWVQKGDVKALSTYIADKVSAPFQKEVGSGSAVSASLLSDLEMILRSLQNNAYASGFEAARSEMKAHLGPR